MMDRFLKQISFTMLVFVFSSCLSSKMNYPLKLEVASCQTWDAGEKHRGTKVEVILIGDMKQVKITELIFRSKSTIPMIKEIDGRLFITANFESGTEKIPEDIVVDNKIDMVIYTHKGKVYELPLKNIKRKPMKYYPKK